MIKSKKLRKKIKKRLLNANLHVLSVGKRL